MVCTWQDSASKDEMQKLRDVKIEYVIDAYGKLCNSLGRGDRQFDSVYVEEMDRAFASIQLFGTPQQVDSMHEYFAAVEEAKKIRLMVMDLIR